MNTIIAFLWLLKFIFIFYNKAKTKLDRKVEKDSKSATNLFQCGINAKIRTVAEAYNFSLSLGCSLLESSFIR